MIGRWTARLAAWLLKNARLDNESRQLLTAAILEGIHALPLHDRISVDETGMVFVGGKPVHPQQLLTLREGAAAMMNNPAMKLVREQIRFLAVQIGVHKNTSPDQGLFAKAALWNIQEEDTLYLKILGDGVK